jgi:hypothetical protein
LFTSWQLLWGEIQALTMPPEHFKYTVAGSPLGNYLNAEITWLLFTASLPLMFTCK